MRIRRVSAHVLASAWLHLSVLALAGIDLADLLLPEDESTADVVDAEGANVDIDGFDANGEATAELVPMAVTVLFEEAPTQPVPLPPVVTEPEPPDEPAAQSAPSEPSAAPVAVASAEPSTPPAQGGRTARPARPPRSGGSPASAKPKKVAGPPCDPAPEQIERVDDVTWAVERSFIEYYATHLKELYKQGSVWTHKGADGKPDGFRMGLTRCSIIKHAGFRNGDIVNRVNSRKIATIPQAIAAYFDLRNDEVIEVEVTRAGRHLILFYQLDQDGRKRTRVRKGDFKDLRRQGSHAPAPGAEDDRGRRKRDR